MKKLIIILFAIFTALLCNGQKYWEDSAYQQQATKASADRKIAREKQHAYWDSVNNNGQKQYKAAIIKKYGKVTGTKIANGEIEVGYTKAMCEAAWGSADTERKDGAMESWYYRKYLTALTFKNGKLIKIID